MIVIHPMRRDYIDRATEEMVYIAERFASLDPEFAQRVDAGEMIRTVFIGCDRTIGMPKDLPAPPCPEFKRADEAPLKVPPTNPAVVKEMVEKQSTLEPPKAPEQKLTHITPAYDREKLSWNRCPKCGSSKVGHASEKTGKGYFGCFDCKIFLQPDGKTKAMVQGGN